MQLDKRIKNKMMIYDCFNTIAAEEYVDKNGYFTNNFPDFADLGETNYGKLIEVATNNYAEKPYCTDGKEYAYFLPEEYVKEEKHFRPFTLEEFIRTVGDVGGCIRYKHKDDPQISRAVITEIMEDTKYVKLGNDLVSTGRLLDEFEYYDGETWVPFGVEE